MKKLLLLICIGVPLAGCTPEIVQSAQSECPPDPGWTGWQYPHWQCIDVVAAGHVDGFTQSMLDARMALAKERDDGKLSLEQYQIQVAQLNAQATR